MSIKYTSQWLFLSKLFGQTCTLASLVIASRFLSFDEYGDYKLFILIVTIVSAICSLGLSEAILYFSEEKNKESYYFKIYQITIVVSIIVFISTLFIIPQLNMKGLSIFRDNLFIFATIFSCSIFLIPSNSLFIANKQINRLMLVQILPNALWVLALLSFWLFNMSNTFFYSGYLIRLILMVVIVSPTVINVLIVGNSIISKVKLRSIMAFSLPVGLAAIIGMMQTYIDQIIINYFYDSKIFAIYANGSYEIPILPLIASSLFGVVIPKMRNLIKNKKILETKQLWVRTGEVLLPLIVTISITCLFFSKEIISVLYSKEYLQSAPIFMIYQLTLLGRVYLYSSLFIAFGKSRLYMFNILASVIINTCLSLLLVQQFGYIGAAISTVTCTYILMFLQLLQISKFLNSTITSVFPWRKWLIAIGISSFISFNIKFVENIFASSLFFSIAYMFVSMIISFLLLSKVVNGELLNLVLSNAQRITQIKKTGVYK